MQESLNPFVVRFEKELDDIKFLDSIIFFTGLEGIEIKTNIYFRVPKNSNSRTTQFLFPNIDIDGIVIPSGIGIELIQIIDNEHY